MSENKSIQSTARLRYYLAEYHKEEIVWVFSREPAFVVTDADCQVMYKFCNEGFPIETGRAIFKYKAVLLQEM